MDSPFDNFDIIKHFTYLLKLKMTKYDEQKKNTIKFV